MRRVMTVLVLVCVLVVLAALVGRAVALSGGDGIPDGAFKAAIVGVVDGDTIDVEVAGQRDCVPLGDALQRPTTLRSLDRFRTMKGRVNDEARTAPLKS